MSDPAAAAGVVQPAGGVQHAGMIEPAEVIELAGVSKKYNMYRRPGDRLKEILLFNCRKYHREHWAVRDVRLSIRRGETFCIIGQNGSGKSTLLKLIMGILQPSAGQVDVRGRATALIELGLGFNLEFTGRANVYLNGAILGFSKRDIENKLGDILAFAEIGSYIDQPVRTYSSGMVVRLAFAVAVHLDPDILVVDEALAVGDIYFRQRCMRKIHELRARGVTIVYVTHDIADVKLLGDRALWLEAGRVVEIGDAREVAVRYLAALVKKDSERPRRVENVARAITEARRPREVITDLPSEMHRHGDGRAEILGIQICDPRGAPIEEVETPGWILVRVSAKANEELPSPVIGLLMRVNQGVDFSGTNTTREQAQLDPMMPGDINTVDFRLRLPELAATRLTVTPAIADGTLLEFQLCDMVEDAVEVRVRAGEAPVYGTMHIPCTSVKLTAAIRGGRNGVT